MTKMNPSLNHNRSRAPESDWASLSPTIWARLLKGSISWLDEVVKDEQQYATENKKQHSPFTRSTKRCALTLSSYEDFCEALGSSADIYDNKTLATCEGLLSSVGTRIDLATKQKLRIVEGYLEWPEMKDETEWEEAEAYARKLREIDRDLDQYKHEERHTLMILGGIKYALEEPGNREQDVGEKHAEEEKEEEKGNEEDELSTSEETPESGCDESAH